jgi:Ca2+-binding EF-hand superfamily protein
MKADVELIDKWVQQYRRTFDDQYLHREEETEAKAAKKVLPSSSLNRLREIFNAIDSDHKGYLVFDDFKKAFKLGYTITEIENIFQKYDRDGSKKLYIYDFAQILLPEDFTIEGL